MKLRQKQDSFICWLLSTVNTFCITPSEEEIILLINAYYRNLNFRKTRLDKTTSEVLFFLLENGMQADFVEIFNKTIEEIYNVKRIYFKSYNELKSTTQCNNSKGVVYHYGHAFSVINSRVYCPIEGEYISMLNEFVNSNISLEQEKSYLQYVNYENPIMLYKNTIPFFNSNFVMFNKYKKYGLNEIINIINQRTNILRY
jgi:hypothetical protein